MSTRSLNKVMLIGNLTRDPNLRYTPNGTAVCSFGIATNRTWTPAEGGDKQERVEFTNIVSWSKLADICGQLLHKGDKVYVEGRLQTRDWKGEDGQERRTTEVVIDNMILLRPGKTSGQSEDFDDAGFGDSSMSTMGNARVSAGSASSAQNKNSKKSSAVQQDDLQQPQDDVSDLAEEVSDDVPF